MRRMRQQDNGPALARYVPKDLNRYGEVTVNCPECGLWHLVYKNFENKEFLGCRRYPLCLGAREWDKSVDSLRELLLRAHSHAVSTMVESLGKARAVAWWLEHSRRSCILRAHDPVVFATFIAEASELVSDATGVLHDFAADAYRAREREHHMLLVHAGTVDLVWNAPSILKLPPPKFTKPWDTSWLRLSEITLQGAGPAAEGAYCKACGTFAPAHVAPTSLGPVSPGFARRFAGRGDVTYNCPNCGEFQLASENRGQGLPVSNRT